VKTDAKRKSNTLRLFNRVLAELSESMTRKYKITLRYLSFCQKEPGGVAGLQPVLLNFAELGNKISAIRASMQEDNLVETLNSISLLTKTTSMDLQKIPISFRDARLLLNLTINLLLSSEKELGKALESAGLEGREYPQAATKVLVPTDTLFHSFQVLFPAERMLVAAGRKNDGRITLGATFDVTGINSAGHVQADPQKLGQALMAMDASSTHMAAWIHSHPGSGAVGTYPSAIDLKQHQDWLRDYSPRLLSIIFVKDRCLRFWGKGLDEGQIELQFVGEGVAKEKEGEHVYRLVLS
jgi:hypothetical protein